MKNNVSARKFIFPDFGAGAIPKYLAEGRKDGRKRYFCNTYRSRTYHVLETSADKSWNRIRTPKKNQHNILMGVLEEEKVSPEVMEENGVKQRRT